MKKAVLYINQFFAGVGGETEADFEPEIREGLVGPALELDKQLQNAEVTHTVICGDNFIGSNQEEAVKRILEGLEGIEFDIFFAGPAFQAGRYGSACGFICRAVKEKFGVETVSSMHVENPGVLMFKKELYIAEGGHIAAKMRKDIKKMANIGDKLLAGETMLRAEAEEFFPRGIRHQFWPEEAKPAAIRAVEMLKKKLAGEEYQTELPIPKSDRVEIAKPIVDLSKARIALMNTGGIVPVDNPDKIQSASATRWGKYDISGMDRLESGVFKTIHAGFDPAAADADPNVIMPIDVMRAFEKEGKIGELYKDFYSTVGTGTTEAEARRMAQEIVVHMKEAQVDAVLMVST
jgi:glycine reductase